MIKKILLFLLVSFIIIVVGGYFFVNNVLIPQNLKPMVIELLEKTTGKNVSISKAEYFPMKGISFTEVIIANDDNTPFVSVEEIGLKLKSFPKIESRTIIANAKFFIKQASFNQAPLSVKGDCVVDALINIKEESTPQVKASVELNNIDIRGISPVVDVLGLQGSLNITEKSLTSESITADMGGQKLKIAVKCDFDTEKVLLKVLSIDYGSTTSIVVSGTVSNLKAPNLNAQFDTSIDLSQIAQLVPGIILPALSGVCDTDGTVFGPAMDINGLQVQAKVKMPEASVDKIKFGLLNADVNFIESVVIIPTFDCGFYQGKVEGSAKASVLEADLPIEASVDVTGLDVDALASDFTDWNAGTANVSAHLGISGSVTDLNSMVGSGWFKAIDGNLKMPNKALPLAQMLKMAGLSVPLVDEASATFIIDQSRVDTPDLKLVSKDYVEFLAKGYATFAQYIDFEIEMNLAESVEAGLPEAITKIPKKMSAKGTIPDIKTKVLIDKSTVIQVVKDEVLKKLFDKGVQDSGEKSQEPVNIEDELKKKGEEFFKGLF